MIIFFNFKGLAFLILAAAIGFGGIALVPSLNGPPFHFIAGGLIIVFDLAYRLMALKPEQDANSGDSVGSGLGLNLSEFWLTTSKGGSLIFSQLGSLESSGSY